MKKIFISHAYKDEPIVKYLMDDLLVGSLSVKVNEIFCTSADGTKIESGEDWRNTIQQELKGSKVTILVITPNYKESEVCLCEMGAAWVTSSKVISFVVNPITYSSVGIIQEPKQIERLLDEKSLDRLRDIIQDRLEIEPSEIKSDRWTAKKIEFLHKTKKHIKNNPFPPALNRNIFEHLIEEKSNLETAIQSLREEKQEKDELIDDLKKAKDKNEIKKIEKKHKKTDPITEFTELCKIVSKYLSELSSIVRGVVYISYSGKEIRVRHGGWQEELDDALSYDFIDEDFNADFETTKLMRNISESLNDLSHFIYNKEEDGEFLEAYTEKFEAPLSLSNREFWEEAFKLSITIS